MKIQTQLFVIALTGIFASCGTVSSDAGASDADLLSSGASTSSDDLAAMYASAPSGEMAPTQRYDVAQIVVAGPTKVGAGLYIGDLVIDKACSKVIGSGPGVTVIDGNLIVGDQCSVVGMTVTGDVIFRGNNSRVFVDCLGQFLDYGMQNQH